MFRSLQPGAVGRIGAALLFATTALTPVASSLFTRTSGQTVGYTSGTAADYIIADNGNDTTGDGSLANPFATPQKAFDTADASAIASPVVRMRGGKYRLDASLDGDTYGTLLTVARYGNEVPIISGGEILSGFTLCDISYSGEVGTNYASVYWADIPAADLNAGIPPESLNLHEAGAPLGLAQDKASVEDDFWTRDMHNYHTADSFNDVGGFVTQVQDASVLGGYTSAQLLNAQARVLVQGNQADLRDITAYNGTDTITFAATGNTRYADVSMYKWSLQNIIPNIAQGQWAFRKTLNGDGSRRIFVWPNDSANLTSNIEFSKRQYGIDTGNCSNLVFDGINVEMIAGGDNNNTIGIGNFNNASTATSNITVKECLFQKFSSSTLAYGGCAFYNLTGLTIQNCSFINFANTDPIIAQSSSNILIDGVYIYKGSTCPMRFNDCVDLEVNAVYCEYGGRDTHSNKIEIYKATGTGCNWVILYAVSWVNWWGYATHQASSNIFVGHCYAEPDDRPAYGNQEHGAYAYKDQNSGGEPDTSGKLVFWNNSFPPSQNYLSNVHGTYYLGEAGSNLAIYNVNNVSYGGGDISTGAAKTTLQANNLFTKSATSPAQNTDPTDTTDPTLGNTYTNAAGGDCTPAVGGNYATLPAYDFAATLATLVGAHFTNIDFTTGFYGNPIGGIGHYDVLAGPDTTAPVFLSGNPADNAASVDPTTNFVLSITETGTLSLGTSKNLYLYNITDAVITETISSSSVGTGPGQVSLSGNNLTVNPTLDLANGKNYCWQWDKGFFKDQSGNEIAANTSETIYNFTTASASSNFAVDGGFDIPADWDTSSGVWAITGSKAVYSGLSASFAVLYPTAYLPVTEGVSYTATIDILDVTAAAGTFYFRMYEMDGTLADHTVTATPAANGTMTLVFTPGAGVTVVRPGFFNSTTGTVLKMDNFTISPT